MFICAFNNIFHASQIVLFTSVIYINRNLLSSPSNPKQTDRYTIKDNSNLAKNHDHAIHICSLKLGHLIDKHFTTYIHHNSCSHLLRITPRERHENENGTFSVILTKHGPTTVQNKEEIREAMPLIVLYLHLANLINIV